MLCAPIVDVRSIHEGVLITGNMGGMADLGLGQAQIFLFLNIMVRGTWTAFIVAVMVGIRQAGVRCACAVCRLNARYFRIVGKLPAKDRHFMESVILRLEAAETERDVNALIIAGKWPSSEAIFIAQGWKRI